MSFVRLIKFSHDLPPTIALAFVLFAWPAQPGFAEPNFRPGPRIQQRILAEDSPQATEYFIQDAPQPGPSVMIVGGVHGNEPAGVEAARQIANWPINRGTLIVLPEANVQALSASKRHTPGVPRSLRDLNRNFPKRDDSPGRARGELASMHWELVQEVKPDWLIDLHEGYDFHQLNDKSVGSSIIVFPRSRSVTVATLMLEAVNETIAEPERRFVPLVRGPVDGSLARAAAEHLGIESMIAETTVKDQPLELRVAQHQVMVERVLRHLRMLRHDNSDERFAQSASDDGIENR